MVVTLVEVVEQNSGWMEKLGWMGWMEWLGTVTPVNGELGVNRLGTSRLEVDEVGVGEVGVVESISSCRQDSI